MENGRARIVARWAALSVVLTLANILQADASDHDAASKNALRDAHQLAACIHKFDERCVIRLSDEKLFQRTGDVRYASVGDAQRTFLAQLQERGGYTRFTLSASGPLFSDNEALYVWVPYRTTSNEKDLAVEAAGFFLGASRNKGRSWKFI